MRRNFEVLALLLLVVFIVAMTSLSRREDYDRKLESPETLMRSSYRTLPDGYKGLFLTLEELGYPVHRQIRPYSLLPKRGLLIVADPYKEQISPYEQRALFAWLQRGNTALIVLEHHAECFATEKKAQAPDPSLPQIASSVKWFTPQEGTTIASPASGLTDLRLVDLAHRAPALTVQSTVRLSNMKLAPLLYQKYFADAQPLYRDQQGVVAAFSPVGAGGIVWCSSPWSFSNAGLPEGKNLDFVLALVDHRPGVPVIFDEYHHGNGAGMTVWNVAPALTKLGAVQLATALVLLLLTLSWRFGPSRLPAEERFARSRAEYLMSMAMLLQRARATQLVRDRLQTMLRRELSRRLGVPVNAPVEHFMTVNAMHRAVDPDTLAQVWQQFAQLDTQQRPRQDALFRLAKQVHRMLNRKK